MNRRRRRRGLVESESETGFVDLDQDTLHNLLKRVDMVTLARAECVNRLWRKVARDDRLWDPFIIRNWINSGKLEHIDKFRNTLLSKRGYRRVFRLAILPEVAKPPPSDFNSIDFSKKIGPWK